MLTAHVTERHALYKYVKYTSALPGKLSSWLWLENILAFYRNSTCTMFYSGWKYLSQKIFVYNFLPLDSYRVMRKEVRKEKSEKYSNKALNSNSLNSICVLFLSIRH